VSYIDYTYDITSVNYTSGDLIAAAATNWNMLNTGIALEAGPYDDVTVYDGAQLDSGTVGVTYVYSHHLWHSLGNNICDNEQDVCGYCYGAHTTAKAFIYLDNAQIVYNAGLWGIDTDRFYFQVIAHEFGHVIGYDDNHLIPQAPCSNIETVMDDNPGLRAVCHYYSALGTCDSTGLTNWFAQPGIAPGPYCSQAGGLCFNSCDGS